MPDAPVDAWRAPPPARRTTPWWSVIALVSVVLLAMPTAGVAFLSITVGVMCTDDGEFDDCPFWLPRGQGSPLALIPFVPVALAIALAIGAVASENNKLATAALAVLVFDWWLLYVGVT